MIVVGLGANLPASDGTPPMGSCTRALTALEAAGIGVVRCSRWYRSAPVPMSDQPWFINGVAQVTTVLDPFDLLAVLHVIEDRFGRVRGAVNAPRVLDLDLLLYENRIEDGATASGLVLPHPRLHERAFVLKPLAEVLPPAWRHPRSGRSLEELIAALAPEQLIERI